MEVEPPGHRILGNNNVGIAVLFRGVMVITFHIN